MIDVMVDLETLATTEDSVIASIGACVMDLEKGTVGATFYMILEIQDQLNKGRIINADTLKWWISQDEKAKNLFHEKAKSPAHVLNTFSQWLKTVSPNSKELVVWGNGSTFDISILENAFRTYMIGIPWGYNGVNDLRTFRRFVANNAKIENNGTAHHALDDAIAQANFVIKHYVKKTETVVQTETTPK